ncbi:CoA transferase [Allonocardiopsis opalescens]|uniref:CoA transferase n=1 Tax=Allonocardiopsis opalescens TaxID=1144618 RepID=UPI001FE4D237|nr:CoA transferase [Allonocardiopsis opalescens]
MLGGSTAARVAAARLRAMGCAVERVDGPPPGEAPAGWIEATSIPAAGGGPLPGCAIGWSGPVGAVLAGERDVQAACGIAQVHGRAAGGPRELGVDYASVCAGVLAAQALAASVLALLRGGPVLRAATSVAQAALLAVTQYVAAATASGGGGSTGDDAAPPGTGPGDASERRERTPPFRSADGVRFEIETLDAEAWLRFWTALGAPRAAVAAGWPAFQSRFATAVCPLPPELAACAAALPYRRLLDAATAGGVSAVPVRGADAPALPVPASEWRLGRTSAGRDRCDGASGGRAYGESGAPEHPLPPLPPDGRAPLAGLRVVEATTRVQGPLAGHLLGLLGAEAVRLEPPGGDPMRGVPPLVGDRSARFLALNRNKGAVEADLKTAAGRRAALRLIASADLFLHNWPPGRAERLGLGSARLAAVRPSLVHVHTGGWADTMPHPQPLGTDYLVQAHSGLGALVGAPGEPPAPSLMTLTDVLGGIIGAEAAVAALLARARTGAGVRAETALVDAARLLRAHARTTGRSAAVPAATELAALAADPAFAAAFATEGATRFARAPWSFAPAARTEGAR